MAPQCAEKHMHDAITIGERFTHALVFASGIPRPFENVPKPNMQTDKMGSS
jgi:hypothetical protein